MIAACWRWTRVKKPLQSYEPWLLGRPQLIETLGIPPLAATPDDQRQMG